ncbi:hypothetical protein Dde_0607 [Oleidesulfovibrio alaskensis G20]|jgi:hypothetical protein|uniref:Uncharacterized protein n=1 Tax=Oleidesulfovibrio alaskensis (strain ATCC BAA-1058 / DSM 17464 / G20) TaxID=207559 RepID=Q315I8_OLEA2|nr:hypothetical protein [Oleidesulfovibrio alaskensis]ABB37408.1 hypothetical protein Dde_0607 [Oleidesulfovibrio alaskensis G20]MBG0774274.1 hypothetical protein [Oleidesulfovibrio alaskensis]MBL3583171.1 hypothetical protein [Oleidesulfovibrio alaskensis]
MANMDYPGPCQSCSGIDGCATDEQRQAAVEHYCKGLEMELNAWKSRLYDVLANDQHKSSQEFMDTLDHIKSTVREMEMLVEKMRDECPLSLAQPEEQMAGMLNQLRTHYSKALSVISPGYFGG